jgi:FHS family L-fucose permease-like MFS transporter
MNYTRPLILVTSLFFLFGFLTCLNDILIPHLKSLFTLSYTEAILVQVCFFSAYFFMSIPSGQVTDRLGYRKGIVLGLSIAALGTLGFIPAAQFQSYGIFLFSLFVLASGITLLQVAVNPYVTLLGDPSTGAFRLNLVQAFNALGTTVAPLIGSALILGSVDKIAGIQLPYMAITVILFFVAIIFSKIQLPTLNHYSHEKQESGNFKQYLTTMKENPRLMLGMLAIFCYVGAEVSIGSYMVSWLKEENVANLSEEAAGHYVAYYWGGAMVGRFLGSSLMAKFSPSLILRFCSAVPVVLILLATNVTGSISMWGLIFIGLFNSIQFPTIFSLSVEGLGKNTAHASGLLCTCIVGGALMPLMQGVLADNMSLHFSYVVPLLCYLYISWVAPKLQFKK